MCSSDLAAIGAGVSWIGLFWLAWVHAGYRMVLAAWPTTPETEVDPPPAALPSVTVLLTVHDAAEVLDARLADLLASDHPRDRFEVLVASDGSRDGTMAVVEAWRARGAPVRGLDLPRGGKSATQNRAMAEITSEVVVFTDADAAFAPDCVRRLAAPFADPTVGCTTA